MLQKPFYKNKKKITSNLPGPKNEIFPETKFEVCLSVDIPGEYINSLILPKLGM